jgi:hypothetical protein
MLPFQSSSRAPQAWETPQGWRAEGSTDAQLLTYKCRTTPTERRVGHKEGS